MAKSTVKKSPAKQLTKKTVPAVEKKARNTKSTITNKGKGRATKPPTPDIEDDEWEMPEEDNLYSALGESKPLQKENDYIQFSSSQPKSVTPAQSSPSKKLKSSPVSTNVKSRKTIPVPSPPTPRMNVQILNPTDTSATPASRMNVQVVNHSAVQPLKGTRRRKGKNPWTVEEFTALVRGMEKYQNRWASILADPEFKETLKRRSMVDLKDKARNERKARERANKSSDASLGVFALVSGAGGYGARVLDYSDQEEV